VVEAAKYQEIAQMPIQVLPDLLLPEVSNLLLHPGWLVNYSQGREIDVLRTWTWDSRATIGRTRTVLHSCVKKQNASATKWRYLATLRFYLWGLSRRCQGYQALWVRSRTVVLSEFLTDAMESKLKVYSHIGRATSTGRLQSSNSGKLYSSGLPDLKIRKVFT